MTEAKSLQIPIHGSPGVIYGELGEGDVVNEVAHIQLAAFMKKLKEEQLKQKVKSQKQIDEMKAENEMLRNQLLYTVNEEKDDASSVSSILPNRGKKWYNLQKQTRLNERG